MTVLDMPGRPASAPRKRSSAREWLSQRGRAMAAVSQTISPGTVHPSGSSRLRRRTLWVPIIEQEIRTDGSVVGNRLRETGAECATGYSSISEWGEAQRARGHRQLEMHRPQFVLQGLEEKEDQNNSSGRQRAEVSFTCSRLEVL
ncbi:hypothetical protein M513_00911 [Trichuris suis]|uniref:Uncharacterized protein n=1 Tax=Trichuris suis TaxID=68888 RepID=A0A085MLQ2_9BILA|nr:hypothetical protein M513_00911 [Trichuris suis]